jgi:hypothetical protein
LRRNVVDGLEGVAFAVNGAYAVARPVLEIAEVQARGKRAMTPATATALFCAPLMAAVRGRAGRRVDADAAKDSQ